MFLLWAVEYHINQYESYFIKPSNLCISHIAPFPQGFPSGHGLDKDQYFIQLFTMAKPLGLNVALKKLKRMLHSYALG